MLDNKTAWQRLEHLLNVLNKDYDFVSFDYKNNIAIVQKDNLYIYCDVCFLGNELIGYKEIKRTDKRV